MNKIIKNIIGETEEEKLEREGPAQKLIGRKVKLNITEEKYEIGNKTINYKNYELIDPEFEKEVKSINSDNRIFTPGTGGTMDYQPWRLNVYINEQGVVDKVNNG